MTTYLGASLILEKLFSRFSFFDIEGIFLRRSSVKYRPFLERLCWKPQVKKLNYKNHTACNLFVFEKALPNVLSFEFQRYQGLSNNYQVRSLWCLKKSVQKIVRGGYFCFFSNSATFRSSCLQIFFKICVLKNFANFTGKHPCWSHFLIKLHPWRQQATILKREQVCFPVKFTTYLRTPIFSRTPPLAASERSP